MHAYGTYASGETMTKFDVCLGPKDYNQNCLNYPTNSCLPPNHYYGCCGDTYGSVGHWTDPLDADVRSVNFTCSDYGTSGDDCHMKWAYR